MCDVCSGMIGNDGTLAASGTCIRICPRGRRSVFRLASGAMAFASASRGSISLVFSFAGFLYFGLGIVSGPLADRFGSRRLAVSGMIMIGLGLAAASAARSLAEVYAAYGLGVGLGVGCAYVPAVGAVQRWFVRRRGFASGLAVSGIGVGTLVMPPLASLLIEILGWRGAYLVLGAFAATIGGGLCAAAGERSARSWPRSRWRSARGLRQQPRTAGRARRRRGDPVTPLRQPLCRLPDLLVRRVRAVRPSRALCRGSRRRAVIGGIAAGRHRRSAPPPDASFSAALPTGWVAGFPC